MINKKKIPSFFVVGSQKSGTTTIHNLFKQHKNISLPEYKETHFFSRFYSRGLNWYLEQFTQDSYEIRGEVDPSYMFFPESYKNIDESIKDPKFIFIFRKPIDRAYSHYLMSYSRGYEKLSFLEAINIEKERLKNDKNSFSFSNHSYMLRGQYAEQIEQFLKYFKDNKVIFLKFDDLLDLEKRNKLYLKLCTFLNIEYFSKINFNIKSNRASTYRSKFLRKNLYNDTFIRRITKKIIFSKKLRNKIRDKLYKINSKNINILKLKRNKENIFKELPNKYVRWNNEEVYKLQKLTNLDLEDWII